MYIEFWKIETQKFYRGCSLKGKVAKKDKLNKNPTCPDPSDILQVLLNLFF